MSLTINETVEPIFPGGRGGHAIVVLGDFGFTKDTSKVYFFGDYYTAKKDHATHPDSLGPEPADWSDNPGLKCVRDIFDEGAIRTLGQTIGVNKVYAVNMGDVPVAEDWVAAFETISALPVKIESYPGLSNVVVHDSIGDHLDALENDADYRNAVVTVPAGATKEQLLNYTDESEVSFVQNSRVHIYTNPDMIGVYTAKIACTPYWQDPGYGTYRSRTAADIQIWKSSDRDELTEAGLVVDAPNLIDTSLAEPYRAVASSHKMVGGIRPTDSRLHIRRNVDYQWEQTDIISLKMVKMNNTAVSKGLIENVANAFLQEQVEAGYLIKKTTVPTDNGFLFELKYDDMDPYKLRRTRKVRPVGSVDTIEDVSVIQVPIGGG